MFFLHFGHGSLRCFNSFRVAEHRKKIIYVQIIADLLQ